jgi:HlyD family secretion protein
VKNKIIIILQIVLILLIGVLFFFRFDSKKEKDSLTIYGNVDIRQVDLGFRVQGKVSAVYVEEGDPVKPGDLLAKLDSVPYDEELEKSIADLKIKEVGLKQAISKLERRELVNQGAISAEELEDAYFEKLALEAQVEAAKARVAMAITEVEDTSLFCPNPGIILTRIREPGSVLKVGDPVLTISLNQPVWIRAYISEPDLGRIYPGMEASIYLDTPGSKVYKGQIGFISPVAEFTPKTVETTDLRTELVYRLRIIIPEPDRYLRQGMPVTVVLHPEKPAK